MTVLEICLDNFVSAEAAASGADRLELCQDLSVGGLTPTAGFVSVIKKVSFVPIFVLIRPRPGDFQYNALEVEQMVEDIRIFQQCGADGFVFGSLNNRSNSVDFSVCQQLVAASSGLPVTFHRAFDEITDKRKALEDIINLGFQRILTSGGSENAFDGMNALQELVSQAGSRITIMPGGGINDENIYDIMQTTGAKEFHSSGRKTEADSPSRSKFCCKEIVYNMKQILVQSK